LVSIIIFGQSLENDIKISVPLLLVLILQSLIVVVLYNDNWVVLEIYENNEIGLMLNHPYLQFLILLEMLLSTLFVIIIMLKIYLNVPPSMRKKTFLAFLGVGIFSSIAILYVFLGGNKLLPGLNMFFNFLGALLFGISFMREPKMLHVLSFKMLRLQIIDTNSGIGIYSYTWNAGNEIGDEVLFSGMYQGISLIVQESVKRGEVEEIKLSHGILIMTKVPKSAFACVLVATKSTAPLRQALMKFAIRFKEQFHNKLDNIGDVMVFNQSSKIIEECFPFLS
jgi:hypothetical protein